MTDDEELPYENPFPLATASRYEVTRFGDVDASSAVTSINVTAKVNTLTEARVKLNARSSVIHRIDFTSQVVVEQFQDGRSRRVFTGFVVEAKPVGQQIEVLCTSLPELNERKLSQTATAGVPHIEMLYTLMRGGGLSDDQIRISGLEALPMEAFEILSPVEGVVVAGSAKVGPVSILSREDLKLDGLPGPEEFVESFRRHATYAVTFATDSLMLAAEEKGLLEIDLALSWLTVRSRYSIAPLPDGTNAEWNRESVLVSPRRGDVVFVRGLRSRRRWLRVPEQPSKLTDLDLTDKHRPFVLPGMTRSLPLNLRQAVLACARAARGKDNVDRITALWEAVEFYVGKTSVPALFTKSERKAIKRAIPRFGEAGKNERLEMLLGDLNNPPLFVKFRRRVAIDGAPVSQHDIDLLSTLRKIRNDVVHGRSPEQPRNHEVNQGVAIVARILVYAINSLAEVVD
ncbi:hypothetical protein ACIBU0_41530 [Streptomyces sp. NPDC049627]|uniref:hypothetical protein n=1 Tax=Streptomyces sp. NPDC049627 TaxID=3365595 RepID=UPI00378FCDB7